MATAKKRPLRFRGWASSFLGTLILMLLVSGGLVYVLPWSEFTAALHTSVGVCFALAFLAHMRGNFSMLISYFRTHPMVLSLVLVPCVLLILVSVALRLPPIYKVFEVGVALRGQADVRAGEWAWIETQPGAPGRSAGTAPAVVSVSAGAHYTSPPVLSLGPIQFRSVPQMVVWIEDMQGQYLETIYATGKIAANGWQKVDFWNADDEPIRRPEALPIWAHARGQQYGDGYFVPTKENPLPDGISGATPRGNYQVHTKLPTGHGNLRVRMEVNRSFDYNDVWHENAFPNDPIYSNNGNSGQPSVLYEGYLNPNSPSSKTLLYPVGHGHYSGKDGKVYPNLATLDTGLELISWALVSMVNERAEEEEN